MHEKLIDKEHEEDFKENNEGSVCRGLRNAKCRMYINVVNQTVVVNLREIERERERERES